jgi:hypothetical protein
MNQKNNLFVISLGASLIMWYPFETLNIKIVAFLVGVCFFFLIFFFREKLSRNNFIAIIILEVCFVIVFSFYDKAVDDMAVLLANSQWTGKNADGEARLSFSESSVTINRNGVVGTCHLEKEANTYYILSSNKEAAEYEILSYSERELIIIPENSYIDTLKLQRVK